MQTEQSLIDTYMEARARIWQAFSDGCEELRAHRERELAALSIAHAEKLRTLREQPEAIAQHTEKPFPPYSVVKTAYELREITRCNVCGGLSSESYMNPGEYYCHNRACSRYGVLVVKVSEPTQHTEEPDHE